MRRFSVLLTALLLLTGALPALAQPAIEGLGAADLALLTGSGMDEDTLHFDLSLDLTLEGDPAFAMGLALTGAGALGTDAAGQALMTLDLSGTGDSVTVGQTPVLVGLRLLDNILYLRMSEDDPWQGMPLDEGLAGAGLPDDTTQMAGAQALDVLGWLAFLGLDAYSNGSRLADSDGQALFQVEVDLGAWLLSPTFSELMTVAGETTGDDTLGSLGPMLGMLLEDLLLTIESAVELESGLMRRLVLDLGVAMNAALLGGSGAQSTEPANIFLTLALDNMRYDGSLELSAPEGAVLAEA